MPTRDDGNSRGLDSYMDTFFGGGGSPAAGQQPRATAGPVAVQPMTSTPAPSSNPWAQRPGSYGGASGQYNYSNPNAGGYPTWNPATGWSNVPATAAAAAPSAFDINSWGQNWLKSGGRTVQDFQNYLKTNPLGTGYSVSGTHGDKITGPNGQGWDAVIAAGLGGQGASWNPFGGPGGNNNAAASVAGTYGDPAYQKLLDMLTQHETDAKARAQTFAGQLGTRVSQLQKPLLNDADVARMRTAYSNPILANRDADLARAKENAAERGWGPNSGIIEGTNRSINENYSNRQASTDAALQNTMIQTDEQRRNEATQLQGLATQALEGGDISSLQSAAQGVNLSNMGLENALQVLGNGGSPGSLMSSLMGLLNPAAGQQNLGLGIQNSNMGGLAMLIQMLGL